MDFFLQSYVRTTDVHPFDFKGEFETATEVVQKLNSLFLAANPKGSWNVLIQWKYLEAEDRYLNCIRIDPFVTNGNLSFVSGDDVTTFNKFRQLFSRRVAPTA